MNTTDFLMMLNYTVVLFYGVLLTASFADVLHTTKDFIRIIIFSFTLLALKAFIYWVLGMDSTIRLYPLIIHLPLALYLRFYCGRKTIEAFASVFIAYLCCIPRQWLGLLLATLLGRGTELSYIIQILCSYPLLALTMLYVSPFIRRFICRSDKSSLLLILTPFLYYIFVYATTVYSSLLYSGSMLIIGFLISILILSYFVSSILYFQVILKRSELENAQALLHLQTEQAIENLKAMRHSEQLAATYRHDMRHHFQYLASCIDSGQMEDAMAYIRQHCTTINKQQVLCYCQNEAINLLLSAYKTKTAAAAIQMDIKLSITEQLTIPSDDLCVIFSNALENALNACTTLPPDSLKAISVTGYPKNGRTFFQIQNPYHGEIRFKGGLPVTDRKGHGIGTQSILLSVERYDGLCSFSAKNGFFTLRIWI